MREVEHKYTADAPVDPTFAPLEPAGESTVFTLVATYFDTPARELAAAGCSLRRRGGGDDSGWHLKCPSDEDSRLELQFPDSPRVPAELRALVTEQFGRVPLVPVARIETRRTQHALAEDGVEVALAASDEVTATVAGETTTWWELELELLPDADRHSFAEVEPGLFAVGLSRARHRSKVSRALADSPPFVSPSDPDAPAADVLVAAFGRHVGMLQAMEAPVTEDAPDAVHKARVATRRLRSLLRAYEPLLDTARTRPLRAELAWLGEALGAPRDAEVLREEFGDLLAELGPETVEGPVARRLLGHLSERHRVAHAALVEQMDTPRYVALTEALVALLVDPPVLPEAQAPARDVLPALVSVAVARVARLRAKAERRPDVLERWHDVRKGAKAVRYALEALTGAFADAKPHVKAWTEVTESFGTLQDAVVARELLSEVERVASAAGESARSYEVLLDVEDDRRDAALLAGRAALMDAEAAWAAR